MLQSVMMIALSTIGVLPSKYSTVISYNIFDTLYFDEVIHTHNLVGYNAP